MTPDLRPLTDQEREDLRLHKLWLDDPSKGKQLNWSGKDLRFATLCFADLSDANLSRTDLRHADLSLAYLRGADLFRANLHKANLSKANLNGANLLGVDLSEADLSQASLFRANLSEANLTRANLLSANLVRASLFNANLRCANLRYADFSNAEGVWVSGELYRTRQRLAVIKNHTGLVAFLGSRQQLTISELEHDIRQNMMPSEDRDDYLQAIEDAKQHFSEQA